MLVNLTSQVYTLLAGLWRVVDWCVCGKVKRTISTIDGTDTNTHPTRGNAIGLMWLGQQRLCTKDGLILV